MTDRLNQALTSINGVAAAEVDIIDGGPVAVRVRMAPGADQRLVADSVQRVLEEHGLRSRVAPPRVEARPRTPPSPPGAPEPDRFEAPSRPVPAGPNGDQVLSHRAAVESEQAAVESPAEVGIASVAIQEARGSVTVQVTGTDGRTIDRRSRPTVQAVDEAIVMAVAELVEPGALPPGLVAIESSRDHPVLTVILEGVDGRTRTGSATVHAGRAFAVARAARRALLTD